MSDIKQLTEQLQSTLKECRDVAAKAENEKRDFTESERKQCDGLLAKAKGIKADITRIKAEQDNQRQADVEMKAFISELGTALGNGPDDVASDNAVTFGGDGGSTRNPRKAAKAGGSWGAKAAGAMFATAKASGVKALTTGSIDVPNVVETEVVAKPQMPRVIDLLVDRRTLGGNTFEFLRQTVRTNNAAPVADGGTKPTSIFTVAPIEDRARVIAHLSEPFPERYLADYDALAAWLDDEMREGVLQALENQIINGAGTGENFTGILNTAGTQSVAWSSNIFTTIRKARTQMQLLNERPNAWIMNPADLEVVDLTTDANGRYYLTGGGGDLDVDALFGGLPRIPSNTIPAGTAILGDFTRARLYVREDLRLDADRSGTLFDTNQVKLRAEGRFGFAVLRPQAFAEVDLTAA